MRGPDGQLRDLSWTPETDVEVEPVPMSSPDGLTVLRHSSAHVLAQAVQDLYAQAKLGIGPPIENGRDLLVGPVPRSTPAVHPIDSRLQDHA